MADNRFSARATVAISFALVVACVIFIVALRQRSITLRGAVVVRTEDPNKEFPIPGVQITAADESFEGTGQSGPEGSFTVTIRRSLLRRRDLTLTFKHDHYMPVSIVAPTGDRLYIVKMAPIPDQKEVKALPADMPLVAIANVSVRYTVKGEETVEIGAGVKTFEVVNKGNVPCNGKPPCSPDGRWKAGVGSTMIDAGEENSFRNARVSCISGPCPFTQIDKDDFSKGGRRISVTARGWSDTTTFMLQAEAVRHMTTNSTRNSYPVIFDQTLSFSVPADAEGTCIVADVSNTPIVFPIDPNLSLSWTDCDRQTGSGNSRLYRCQLKQGYVFR